MLRLHVLNVMKESHKGDVLLRTDLEKKGNIIGPNDLIIAATTLAHGATLITHNIGEFERIDDLLVEDWTK